MSDDASVMDDVKAPFEKSFAMLKWDCIGEVLVTKVGAPGEAKDTDGPERAAALAASL